MLVYQQLIAAKAQGKKSVAILIDPDAAKVRQLDRLLEIIQKVPVDYIFVGGSIVYQDVLDTCIRKIKSSTTIPVVIFPGSPQQIHKEADGILLLSLISGRNAEYLIGTHVQAAPALKASGLEVIPTGYILIDGGNTPSAAYITQTIPIPGDKPEIAACTALAGEMLGLQLIYLEAGSGARIPVSPEIIRQVTTAVALPVIVGGGIRTQESARAAFAAGADMIVIGTAVEENPGLLERIVETIY
jgi:putative glycerol-1-phosphate prenyltransferase